MDLKMHLCTVAPFVKMAEKTTMCSCESRGVPASRMLSRLIREVQLYLQQHAKGSPTSSRMEESLCPQCFSFACEENWSKLLAVWHHLLSEHLDFMLRPASKTFARVDFRQGLDPSMALDFLETCATHGVGVRKDLEELCQLLRRSSYFG